MSAARGGDPDKALKRLFEGKRILVTGGTGSIGSELVRQLLAFNPAALRVLSRDESKQYMLHEELRGHSCLRMLIGDVRDRDRIMKAMEGVDIVFHAAALKHVPSCEYNPYEAVETNVRGTENVLAAAAHNRIEKLIAVSTDKAVSPMNVMGATKLLAERLVSAAQFSQGQNVGTYCCVRFGNVIGSRGSVLPTFRDQIRRGGPVTVTVSEMTRFVMLVPQAVRLIFHAAEMMQGGDLFILKMPVAQLGDLVTAAVEELAPQYGMKPRAIEVRTVGIRPGEKLHEELMTSEEALRAQETEEMFIVVPTIMNPYAPYEPRTYARAYPCRPRAYISADERPLSVDELRSLVRVFHNDSRYLS